MTLIINGEVIYTTHDHPFYVGGTWVGAADLQVGDDVRRFDGSTGEVQSLQVVQRPQRKVVLPYACSSLPGK